MICWFVCCLQNVFFFCTNIQQHTLTNNRILFPGEKLWEKFLERKSGLKLQSNHYPSSLVTNHALSPTHCVQRLCTPFTELPTTSSTSSHSWPRPRPNHVTWEWNGISRHNVFFCGKIKRNWIVCHLGQGSDESSEKCNLWCEKKLQTHDQNGHHCVGSTLHYMVALL